MLSKIWFDYMPLYCLVPIVLLLRLEILIKRLAVMEGRMVNSSATVMKSCQIYLALLVFLVKCSQCSTIKGYNFGDNKMNVRMGPDDGYLKASLNGRVPSTLTICVRLYPNYKRHGDQFGVWHLKTPYDERTPVFNLGCQSNGVCSTLYWGRLIDPPENAYPKVNWIRKWTSICMGLDFLNNDLVYYVNGKEVEQDTERKESGNPLDLRFPSGYFSGNYF